MYDLWKLRLIGILLIIVIGVSAFAHDGFRIKKPIIIPISKAKLENLAATSYDRIPVGPVKVSSGDDRQNWNFLGPQPILNEYWSGYADASGRISSIIVDPTNPNMVYLAAAQGGVWKTTDGGVNWSPLTDHLSSLASGYLAFDPANSNIIYYATGEQHFSADSYYGDGLFKTTDGGVTWSKIAPKDTVGSYIARILINPSNSNIIHLGSDRGYLQSTDGGSSWNLRLNANWCTDIVVSSSAPSVVFAAIHSTGIFKSTNDGTSWVQLTSGLPSSGFGRINMAISQSNANIVYASFIANSGALYGMYKTTDAGNTWTNLSNTPNYVGYQGWYDNCVIVHPTNPNICYAGGVFPYGSGYYGLIKTTDGGNSWTDVTIGSNGQLHPDQHCLAFGPNNTLWVGNDGGVWNTTDGGQTWNNCNHTLGVTQFYTLAIHPTNPNFLLGGNQDNGSVWYTGTIGWQQVFAGDGGPVAIEWDSPNIFYTTYVHMTYLYKYDNGNYLGDVTGPWSGDRASWCNGPLVVDQNQPDALLVGTYRVFRTINSGNSWTQISGDLTGGSGYLRALAVSATSSNIIYSGSSDGRVFVTTDGSTWNPRYTGLPAAAIPDVIISPSNWQTAYICVDRSTGGRVYQTTDAGVSWSDITGDLSSGLRGMSLTGDFSLTPPTLYLGTDYGVYYSTNGGTNWSKYGSGLPNVAVYEIGCDMANGLVVAATHGRGMWSTILFSAVKEEPKNVEISSTDIKILRNPVFGNSFTIYLNLVKPGNFTFGLFDILGRELRTFSTKQLSQGTHRLTFSIDGLSAGLYFIKNNQPFSDRVIKLVVVK